MSENPFELSIVMPCLNEAETVGKCIERALTWMNESKVTGEVVVADNGSTDGSQDVARNLGARVVAVMERGYGSALMGGIAAARGAYLIMGDSDMSYDFGALTPFLEKLREGYDLVQGCRLPSGGGRIEPGAMPWSHRLIGNPFFSFLARRWFGAPINDVYCGLRGFRRGFLEKLELRCTGMEFATEMILKASRFGCRIAEVPITLHPDGRKGRAPHLRTLRDGWRTLRFFLFCSPRRLFLIPGMSLLVLGALLSLLVYGGFQPWGIRFDAHTLVFASIAVQCGVQALFFGLYSRTFATDEGVLPPDPQLAIFFSIFTLELGLLLGITFVCGGFLLSGAAFWSWWETGFGPLDYSTTMRLVIPGATAIALGIQIVFGSFQISLLSLRRKRSPVSPISEGTGR